MDILGLGRTRSVSHTCASYIAAFFARESSLDLGMTAMTCESNETMYMQYANFSVEEVIFRAAALFRRMTRLPKHLGNLPNNYQQIIEAYLQLM